MTLTTMGGVPVVLMATLLLATAREMRHGDFPAALPAAISFWFLVKAFAAQGVEGGVLAASGFVGGACMLAVPAIFGKVRARHALLLGMVGAALGLEALFTAFLFTCLAWIFVQSGIRLERIILRKRLFRNIYCSSRFILAGPNDVELFFEENECSVTIAYGPMISIGAISAMLWHMSGYRYLAML